MNEPSDGLPVLVIDGAHFSDLDGFTREFSRLLVNYTWRGNLDAFNDLLRGGFGTPENVAPAAARVRPCSTRSSISSANTAQAGASPKTVSSWSWCSWR
jgi:hypothetical protein